MAALHDDVAARLASKYASQLATLRGAYAWIGA